MKKDKLIFNLALRIEKSKQFSGKLNSNKIEHLKEKNYYIKNIPLDGDAPKQYIKAYFYYKDCPKKKHYRHWDGYFAKFGGKSYPHESVVEFIINKIGDSLGLEMNETKLVLANKQIRFLSKDFLTKNQKLIHGIEIIGEYFEDIEFAKEIDKDKKERRKYLTFELVEKAICHVYPENSKEILNSLVKLIVFDAIVGNNDRHYYNWGLIGNVKKGKNKSLKFAPIYDSARALLWSVVDEKIERMFNQYENGSNEIDSFIKKSKPRISFESNHNANHFELVQFLLDYKKEYSLIIRELISSENMSKVENCIRSYSSALFEEKRTKMILIVISKRFDQLQNLIL